MEFSRRDFLRSVGATAAALSLSHLEFVGAAVAADPVAPGVLPPLPDYRKWEDLIRQSWTWDKVVKSTHIRTNCIAACSWDLFVKDGIVWREEQNAIYEKPAKANVPDMNPRGCQKGGCYSQLMYEPSRLKYPLERVGDRGSGKWQRRSWDEALARVADTLLDVATKHGPDTIVYDHGTTNIDFGTGTSAEMRFFHKLGATVMDSWAGVGDLPMGCIQTWGNFNADGTSDDWFNADYVLIWIANPVYTRIPDAHFFWEARYRGASIVSIAPDFNASSIHADLWLNPRMGTDAALGLAMAHVIIGEKLFKEEYVKEQTDLPFLIRSDTRRYLRQSDLQKGGKEDIFYVWDEATGRIAEAPGSQGSRTQDLRLNAIRPALRGKFKTPLANGKSVEVRPMMEMLIEHLEAYTPEKASKICGVNPNVITRVARELAKAETAMIFASWGACKHYHSDLVQRTMCLLMALTGNQGKRGGGIRPGAWYSIDALNDIAAEIEIPLYQKLLLKVITPSVTSSEGWPMIE